MINNKAMKTIFDKSEKKKYISPLFYAMEIDSEQLIAASPVVNKGQEAETENGALEKHNNRTWGDVWNN